MTNPILVVVQVSISPWNSATSCLMHPYSVYMKLLFHSCSQLEWSSGSSCVLSMALIQVCVCVVLEGGAQIQACPTRLPCYETTSLLRPLHLEENHLHVSGWCHLFLAQ